MKIYVIHENTDWILPLRKAFNEINVNHEEWFIDRVKLNLNEKPPQGIFYNRMSASSHTRDHRYAVEMTGTLLAWLESHGRKVVNGRRALQLEVRKTEQMLELNRYGIKTPKTISVNDADKVLEAAKELNSFPLIVKPNRGGKGLGVQLFYNATSLDKTIKEDRLGESLDGVWLIQEYIKPQNGSITRVEFVGGKFIYAVQVDASNGFQLCPADECDIEGEFCPVNSDNEKFRIIDNYKNPDLNKYQNFLKDNNIQVGALEYVKDASGQRYVYDVNTNTNYNSQAEKRSVKGLSGMKEIAIYLKESSRVA
jgi:hypothetical protein